MREFSFVRRAVLAGALALSFTGVAAAVDGVQAMPVAASLSQQAASGATAVQYMRYRHYYRHRHAGLYNCGPGSLHTHLSRKACGVIGPSRQFLYRR